MRLVELHKYEAARRGPVADEVYRANANILLHDEPCYRCASFCMLHQVIVIIVLCQRQHPAARRALLQVGLYILLWSGAFGAQSTACMPAQLLWRCLASEACVVVAVCPVNCWDDNLSPAVLLLLLCRFAFMEGVTSGAEVGNDHAQFAPSLTKLEPTPPPQAAAADSAAAAAADGADAQQQQQVEGGQLQLQLLEPDKSELQPLGLDVSFQEYIKSLMASPAGVSSKDRVFLLRSSKHGSRSSRAEGAAGDGGRLLQVLQGVAVANGLECKISCQNSKVGSGRFWGAGNNRGQQCQTVLSGCTSSCVMLLMHVSTCA